MRLAGSAPRTRFGSRAIEARLDFFIDRGHYLAIAADCAACHTANASKPMAGGGALPTPFGTIYTPNITPDKETGIGNWTDDDFLRAMQQGIGKNGEHLYPAFPYDSYTLLSRDDVLAIKAYLFSLPPVHNFVPGNELSFPFDQRWILWGWKLFNFRDARFTPDQHKSDEWNARRLSGECARALRHLPYPPQSDDGDRQRPGAWRWLGGCVGRL